jgi:hypothetical protein
MKEDGVVVTFISYVLNEKSTQNFVQIFFLRLEHWDIILITTTVRVVC